jgi:carboxymethylenebutenolidase
MSHWIELSTSAGPVRAWQALPEGRPRAGLVVIQEIFGANAHIRAVADGYAAQGYAVLAPSFFDPVQQDVELGYDADGFAQGRALATALGIEPALAIVQAAAAQLRSAHPVSAVGAVGYCWGGTVAMLAALRLGLPASSYYGARSLPFLEDPGLTTAPRAPVIFHFGERDSAIPAEAVQAHRRALPGMAVHTYPADHAFNRDVDPSAYEPASAALARQRSLAFFEEHLQ